MHIKYTLYTKPLYPITTIICGVLLFFTAACSKFTNRYGMEHETNRQAAEKDDDGSTCCHVSVLSGSLPVVNLLIDRAGIQLNEKDNNGQTSLHYAVRGNYKDITKALIRYPFIQLNEKDSEGRTPLDLAKRYNSIECIKILKRAGAK